MTILGWTLAGVVALLLGSGFAFLSGSLILGAVPAVSVLLITAYLSWECGGITSSAPGKQESGQNSSTTAYGTAYTNTMDGDTSSGGNCGFGGDGGGAGGC